MGLRAYQANRGLFRAAQLRKRMTYWEAVQTREMAEESSGQRRGRGRC